MATPTNASAIAAASAAKAAAVAAANQAKAAATTAAANARSAAIAPSVQNVIGNINTGISALSNLVNTKAPTAAQQAAVSSSLAAQQEALAAQAPVVTTATTGYNTSISNANTDYSNAINAANAISVPDPIYDTGPTGATDSATQTNQANAAAQAIALLESYGLSADIGAGLTALAQNGLDSTTIISILDAPNPTTAITGLNLQGSQLTAANQLVTSWQARFPGNQARIAAGLTPIDPATYIANETAYKQVMTMAGIPASSPLMQTSYLGNLMGQDVSPAEVASRVSTATSAIQNEDPAVIAQLQSQFGLSQSSLVSHLLDPTVTAPVIQQEYNAATIAAEAARAGVAITVGNTGGNVQGGGLLNNNSLQMQLAAQGVTQSQAQQGFQAIAAEQPALQSIAGRYGAGVTGPQNVGQALTAATFNTTGAAAAQQQINLLKTAEASAFSGSAGAVTGSLGPRDTSGLQ